MGRRNKGVSARGRACRIGSYAIASSVADPTCISCTTFNILAPIYKRLNHEVTFFYLSFSSNSTTSFPSSYVLVFAFFFFSVWFGIDCVLGFGWREEQDQSIRESENKAYWLTRNHMILDWLLCERSSTICLQVISFWVLVSIICIRLSISSLWLLGPCLSFAQGILGWEWRARKYLQQEAWRCWLYYF